jgi:hypothetical protein
METGLLEREMKLIRERMETGLLERERGLIREREGPY